MRGTPMKKIVAVTLAVAALAVPAAQAGAATNQGPTLAQFKALQTQVKSLQKFVPCTTKTCATVKALTTYTDALFGLSVCQNAVIADELQGTWAIVDQIAQATQSKTYFGAQTPISDSGACTSFRI